MLKQCKTQKVGGMPPKALNSPYPNGYRRVKRLACCPYMSVPGRFPFLTFPAATGRPTSSFRGVRTLKYFFHFRLLGGLFSVPERLRRLFFAVFGSKLLFEVILSGFSELRTLDLPEKTQCFLMIYKNATVRFQGAFRVPKSLQNAPKMSSKCSQDSSKSLPGALR